MIYIISLINNLHIASLEILINCLVSYHKLFYLIKVKSKYTKTQTNLQKHKKQFKNDLDYLLTGWLN
jgi:hypothetical protein